MEPRGGGDDASEFTHMRTSDAEPGDAPDAPGPRPTPQRHVPVLLGRVLGLLDPALSGGRTRSSSTPPSASAGTPRRSSPGTRRLTLVGLDRDPEAQRLAAERLAPYADRIHLVHAVFDELADVLDDLGLGPVSGRPVRPRGLLAAARRGRARVLLLPRRAARHADGPDDRPQRGRRAQHLRAR